MVRQKLNWIKRKNRSLRKEGKKITAVVHADDIFFLVTTNHLYCVVDYCSRSRIDNKEMNTRDMK